MTNEQIKFRIFEMPCCKHQLCWVNPRLPSYCPECGASVYMKLRTGQHTMFTDNAAWLKFNEEKKA